MAPKSGRLKRCFRDFCLSTSLAGYRHMITADRRLGRYFWRAIHAFAAALLVHLALRAHGKFSRTPVVTSLASAEHPVDQIDFPAVTVCDVNKIDRRRAEEFARRSDVSTSLLRHLGVFYDPGEAGRHPAQLAALEDLLGDRDLYGLPRDLATPCSEMLERCYWAGEERPCGDLFVPSPTADGFCCLFNHVPSEKSPTTPARITEENGGKPLKAEGFGSEPGLTVRLAVDEDAYFYTADSTVGVRVHVVQNGDFPDVGLETPVPPGVEAFLRLSFAALRTTPEARRYPVEKRNCVFEDEAGGGYSFGDCMRRCRAESVVTLCRRVPFDLRGAFASEERTCGFGDLLCLDKYREKWNAIYPIGYEGDLLRRERESSLWCEERVPTCSDTLYRVQSDRGELTERGNASVVHVFFQEAGGPLFEQDVLHRWFDIVGVFGGIFGLTVGASAVGLAEVVCYFTYHLGRPRNARAVT